MEINSQKIHPRHLVVRWMITFFSILAISLVTSYIKVEGMIPCLMFAFVYTFLYSLVMMLYEILSITLLEKIQIRLISIILFNTTSVVVDYIVFVFSLFLLSNKGIIYYRNSIVVFIICFMLQAIGRQLFKKGEKKAWQKNQSY